MVIPPALIRSLRVVIFMLTSNTAVSRMIGHFCLLFSPSSCSFELRDSGSEYWVLSSHRRQTILNLHPKSLRQANSSWVWILRQSKSRTATSQTTCILQLWRCQKILSTVNYLRRNYSDLRGRTNSRNLRTGPIRTEVFGRLGPFSGSGLDQGRPERHGDWIRVWVWTGSRQYSI